MTSEKAGTPAVAAVRSTSADPVIAASRPFRGRRISWREFYQLRPDLRRAPNAPTQADNDNEPQLATA